MKKLLLFITGMVCAFTSLYAQSTSVYTLSGIILSAKEGTPLVGATVKVKNNAEGTVTDVEGKFNLQLTILPDTLEISRIGFYTVETVVRSPAENPVIIKLVPSNTRLQEVTVSTGYQNIPKERATGSFDFIDNKLLNRSVSPDILSRLQGIASGLLFDNNTGNTLGISIRGRSTIFASTQPLIVVDNFPYDGDINNINPDDVQSITILKDAAAASIWGARAGNGVIVITTKKGNYNSKLRVSFNSNVTVFAKPDLFSLPQMSSSDYIDVETYLFNQGYYNSIINSPNQNALSHVVDLLNKEQNGQISSSAATGQINALRNQDVRHDFLKYLYRNAVNQQYAVNLSGGGANQRYYLSAGYDNDLNSLVGDQYKRYTVNADNTYAMLHHRLEITTGISLVQTFATNNGLSPATLSYGHYNSLYPYARLADAQGNALIIPKYSQEYIDTAGDGKLLDWNYRPLDELKYGDNTTTGADYRLNLGIRYKILKGLNMDLKYLYEKQATDIRNLYSLQTFYTRNYINQFSQINWTTGQVTYPVPMGGILDINNTNSLTQDLRGQLNYSNKWGGGHQLTAIAGAEISDMSTEGNSYRFYGYDPVHVTSIPVDFANWYPNYITGSSAQIYNGQGSTGLSDRDVSVFANAAYTYKDRYTLSASARKDASNLFGVNANQKWVPLWSAGAGWNISQEAFYHMSWLPYLKLRATYGYSGNVDKTVTALLTSRYVINNLYGVPYSQLVNPPNPDLRWEKVSQANLGIDFGTHNNSISGSIEYYLKKGTDLMGYAPLAPSTGLTSYKGNTSDMKARGIDFTLNTHNINRIFKWYTTFLLSYSHDWVTSYKVQATTIDTYITGYSINPVVGKPVSAIYSYQWAGLYPATGDPLGYVSGKVSNDYSAMINSTDRNDMRYNGPAAPPVFGGMLNSFSWKQFSLSFNVTYKLGDYFRRNSINYGDLFDGNSEGNSDYDLRWQKPGDEKKTYIPSMIYPDDPNRDHFYQYASVLVESGDEIRLEDIRLSYTLSSKQERYLPFSSLEFYVYADNIGILWRANKQGIDPDFVPDGYYDIPVPKSISAGLKIHFK